MAKGKYKAEAFYHLIEAKQVTSQWPVTFLKNHENVTVIADQAAASFLSEKVGVRLNNSDYPFPSETVL